MNSTDLLCDQCADNVNRRFLGISKNTQLLGDELLDCITDVLSLETAIFTFMEDKANLEQEYCSIEPHKPSTELSEPNYTSTLTLNISSDSGRRFSTQSSVESDISSYRR